MSDVFTITQKILKDVREEEDAFIITTITPFITDWYKQVIPKKLLVLALTTFQREHKEIWDSMMDEMKEKYG